jgi:hypothetical protein
MGRDSDDQQKHGKRIFYTALGYLAILATLAVVALSGGAATYWSGFYLVMISASPESASRWVGFTVNTPMIFGWVVKKSRPRWRNNVFWPTITSLLLLHVAGFLTVSDWTFERFGKKHPTSLTLP